MAAHLLPKVAQIETQRLKSIYDSEVDFSLWNIMLKLSGAFFVYFFSYQVYYKCLDLEDRCPLLSLVPNSVP